MRLRVTIHFVDHAGFQRATLHVAVACSALAGLAALAGVETLRPATFVLGAVVATLALAFDHVRVTPEPVENARSTDALLDDELPLDDERSRAAPRT